MFSFFNFNIRENFPCKNRVVIIVEASMMLKSDDTTYPEDPTGPTDFL